MRPEPNEPRLRAQREALKAALQSPGLTGPYYDTVPPEAFIHPAYVALHRAVLAAGGTSAGQAGPGWLAAVRGQCPQQTVRSLVTALAVEPLMMRANDDEARYLGSVLARLRADFVGPQVADFKSRLQRMSPEADADEYYSLLGDLVALEQYYRALREQAMGALG